MGTCVWLAGAGGEGGFQSPSCPADSSLKERAFLYGPPTLKTCQLPSMEIDSFMKI